MKPLDMPKKDAAKSEAAPAEAKKEEVIDFSKVEIEPLFKDFVDFETFSKSDFRAVKVKSCEAVKKSKKLLKFVLDDGTGEDRVILSGIHEYYEPEELVGKTCVAITNLPPRPMMGIDSCGMLRKAQKSSTSSCSTPTSPQAQKCIDRSKHPGTAVPGRLFFRRSQKHTNERRAAIAARR